MEKITELICQHCGKAIESKTAKWLELSITDGNYYVEIPLGHDSQGSFPFGISCATNELKKTTRILKDLIYLNK